VDDDQHWATPEEAAVRSYPEAAQARVVNVERVEEDLVIVHVKVGPDYDYFEYVWRSPSGWYASSGHN
jgi:hypothetical protein